MANNLFQKFVDDVFDGSQTRTAEALECTRSQVNRMCSGERAVTPETALKAEILSHGRFTKESFVWPESQAA